LSNRLPMLKGREVISVLVNEGFYEVRRSQSSHVQLAHPDGRRVTVPDHNQTDIGRGLLRKIIRDAHISHNDFVAYV